MTGGATFFALVTFDVLVEVKIHWNAFSAGAKVGAVALVANLILMPLLIMRRESKGQKYRTAQVLFFAFASVLMAILVFSAL